MRKWRPAHKCLYVIPEIHGSFKSLQIIIDRIFPLRFSINQEDSVIFLGDYVDKGFASYDVIELLIAIQKEYPTQVEFIRGNHEQLFLNALMSEEDYNKWIMQGGLATLASYIYAAKLDTDASRFPFSRLKDIVPDSHILFLKSLPLSIRIDEYMFFHGGVDVVHGPEQTSDEFLMFDTSCSRSIKKSLSKKEQPLLDSDVVYIGAHNYGHDTPFIYSKYFMLGGGAPSKLIVFDLMSMTCAMVKDGKSRIYKHNFKYYE